MYSNTDYALSIFLGINWLAHRISLPTIEFLNIRNPQESDVVAHPQFGSLWPKHFNSVQFRRGLRPKICLSGQRCYIMCDIYNISDWLYKLYRWTHERSLEFPNPTKMSPQKNKKSTSTPPTDFLGAPYSGFILSNGIWIATPQLVKPDWYRPLMFSWPSGNSMFSTVLLTWRRVTHELNPNIDLFPHQKHQGGASQGHHLGHPNWRSCNCPTTPDPNPSSLAQRWKKKLGRDYVCWKNWVSFGFWLKMSLVWPPDLTKAWPSQELSNHFCSQTVCFDKFGGFKGVVHFEILKQSISKKWVVMMSWCHDVWVCFQWYTFLFLV